MKWFLALLFWNPAIQTYDVADGWYPIGYETYTQCEMRLDYVRMYLPVMVPDTEHVVDCIQAKDMWVAINIAKETAND